MTEKTRPGLSGPMRFVGAYTALFAVVALLAFIVPLAQGKTLIWEGDGMKQHLQALAFMGMWLRSAFESLASGGGFNLPTFSFAMGYGSDIVSNMSYYAIGDPLNLVSILVPADRTYILFNVLAVLRMHLAGLAFSLYCHKMRLACPAGILAGAIGYAFCLFALCAAVRHPFFLNAMVYFPLVLLGIERIISARKSGLFIAAIAVSALSNFYFFYMIFVLMALYIIWRLAWLHGRDIKASLRDFGWLVGCGSIGVLISCILFVPSAIAVFSDVRSTGETAAGLLYGSDYYKSFLFGYASVADPGDWSFCGFGAITLLSVFLLFSRKGNRPIKIAFAALSAMLLVPAAGLAMNGFSYVSNRWIWGYSMLVCCILAMSWNRLRTLDRKSALLAGLCMLAYLAASAWCGSSIYGAGQAILLCAFQGAIAAGAIALSRANGSREGRLGWKADAGLLCLLAATIAANAFCLLAPFAGGYADKLLTWDYASNLQDSEAKITADEADGDHDFWRYSGSYWILRPNAGLTANAPSTDYYWSLSNPHIAQFMAEMGVNTQEYEANRYRNLDERTMLETLARVDYHLAVEGEPVPYGFALSEEEAEEQSRSWKIYENENPLPFAYTSSTQICRTDYASLGMAKCQQALLQSVVTDQAEEGIDFAQIEDESSSIPFTVETSKGVTANPNGSFTADGPGYVTLTFEGLPKTETYLEVRNLVCSTPRSKLGFGITFTLQDGSETERTLRFATEGYHGSSGRTSFLVNGGYSEQAATRIRIKLPVEGTYLMDLSVICQGFENYPEQVAALASAGESDLDLGYPPDGLAASNRISFDIGADKRSVLTTAVPYSKGWSISVDGKPVDHIRTNTMYLGCTVEAGTHHVEMTYRTPGLRIGAMLSATGLLLLGALMAVLRRRGRENRRG